MIDFPEKWDRRPRRGEVSRKLGGIPHPRQAGVIGVLLCCILGCGEKELAKGNDGGVEPDSGIVVDGGVVIKDYSPLTAGSWWKYEDIDNPGTYHNDVLSGPVPIPNDVKGRSAFLLTRTHSDDAGDVHRTYVESKNGLVVRYRKEWDKNGSPDQEKVYDPFFLELDMTQLKPKDAWKATFVRSDYDGTGALTAQKNKAYQYTVESTADPLTVKGKTLSCVKITRLDLMDGDSKTFWYAEGVGRVKEIGVTSGSEDEAQEMLVDYEVK